MADHTIQVAQQPTDKDKFNVLLANEGKETRKGKGMPGLTRKERKRDREKKRRTEMNRAFNHLLDLLFCIDPAFKSKVDEKTKRGKEKDDHPPMNRVEVITQAEIITQAATTLERLNKENSERNTAILQLTKNLLAIGNNGALPSRPPPPALVPTTASRSPNSAALALSTTASGQNIEIQELPRRQQMEMDAIVASSVAASPSHPYGPAPKLRLKHSMGLGLPHQSTSLTDQLHAFEESNPMAGPSPRHFNPNDLIHGATSDPRLERLEEYQRTYQAYMHQLLLELEEVQAALAQLAVAPSHYSAGIPESLVPMSGDSIREEAAAHSQGEVLPESMIDAPASKRLRNAY